MIFWVLVPVTNCILIFMCSSYFNCNVGGGITSARGHAERCETNSALIKTKVRWRQFFLIKSEHFFLSILKCNKNKLRSNLCY